MDTDAFVACVSLTSLVFPSTLRVLRDCAFMRNALKELTIPGSVASVAGFGSSEKLRSVVFEEGVKEIVSRAFSCCEKLRNVTFPDSLEKIGEDAFSLCDSLRSVTLPAHTQYHPKAFPEKTKILRKS
ncbi:MAG: leucine-rich repeat domain-containing protein [Thermoguttaceae bacterium]